MEGVGKRACAARKIFLTRFWPYAVHRIMPIMRSPLLCGLRTMECWVGVTGWLPYSA
jgi:hypothetical protein